MKFTTHDYHLEAVNDRLLDLLSVLQYDSEEEKRLTVWERMYINQQRGDLFVFKRSLFGELHNNKVRFYLLPEPLETKVETIIDLIKSKNWKSNYEDIDKYTTKQAAV